MRKNQKKKNNLIKNIINCINSDSKLKSTFNHPKRKFKLYFLISNILEILITGLSFI